MAVDSAGALTDASTGRAVHPQQIDVTPPHQEKACAHAGVLPGRLVDVTKDTIKISPDTCSRHPRRQTRGPAEFCPARPGQAGDYAERIIPGD
jgi:hypothetical protein